MDPESRRETGRGEGRAREAVDPADEPLLPDLADIDARRELLECAIYTRIKTKGTPGCDEQPLQYGKRFAFCFTFPGRSSPGPGVLWAEEKSATLFRPRPGQSASRPIASATFERASGGGGGGRSAPARRFAFG